MFGLSLHRAHRRTRFRPAVEPLEDRSCPASAAYDPVTATLTVTAGGLVDTVDVSHKPGAPAGYVNVSDGQPVFDSAQTGQPVRHLVVSFPGVKIGELNVGADVALGGNLTVYAGPGKTTAVVKGAVGGAFRFFGAAGNDTVTLAGATIGGGAYVGLGGGFNTLDLDAGLIGRGLVVRGGAGDDTVHLLGTGDLTVGGGLDVRLGGGSNLVVSAGTHRLQAGRGLVYAGGSGSDSVQFQAGGSAVDLALGGGVVLTPGGGFNNVNFGRLTAGGGLAYVGGAGIDDLSFSDETAVGGSIAARLGDGPGQVRVGVLGAGAATVGGNFTVLAGSGADDVNLNWLTVGGNLAVNVGANLDFPQIQQVLVGTYVDHPVAVLGSVTVLGGDGQDRIELARVGYLGGGLTVKAGGGNDVVYVDDVAVSGPTVIDLGGGPVNRLFLDDQASDIGGLLPKETLFGGPVTVRGGAGTDKVSVSATNASKVRFAGVATFRGGDGADSLTCFVGTQFLATGNTQDFETYTGPVLK